MRVYLYSAFQQQCIQVGQDLDGESTEDELGWSLALSADGKILVAGANYNDGNVGSSGHVRVYS